VLELGHDEGRDAGHLRLELEEGRRPFGPREEKLGCLQLFGDSSACALPASGAIAAFGRGAQATFS
jgi:hypothetical protein